MNIENKDNKNDVNEGDKKIETNQNDNDKTAINENNQSNETSATNKLNDKNKSEDINKQSVTDDTKDISESDETKETEKSEEKSNSDNESKEEKMEMTKITKKKKKEKKKKKFRKLRIFIRLFLALMLIAIIAATAVVMAIFKTDKWTITEEQLLSDSGAKVYDLNGNEILTLTGSEINKKIELSEMGKIPDAFVSIEDERYYQHKGIDIKRTAHAILDYIIHKGNSNFGGSSITQQLVKITMKDNEQSGIAGIQRKIREWSRATQVEKMLNKDQILQRYLNRIYLGASDGLEVRGVESAANYYFNKSAKDLSIAECCFIAGINHSPNNYNPFTSKEDISERIKTRTLNTIGKMHDLGKITDDEYNTAVEETNAGLKFEKGDVSNGNSKLSYHTAAAINQIANELSDRDDISYDEAREQLIGSGYSIYTTVDTRIQDEMKTVFQNDKYIYKGTRAKADIDNSGQSAMVVIEPKTGYVVGEMGGLGSSQNTLGLNRGVSKRQGGSAFKPLVTIAPGLENKIITASTLFYDVQTKFGNYNVSNDSNSYHDIENMRSILTHSCNVPEVKLLSIMGVNKSAEFLSQIGINTDGSHAGLSMALGTVDVSPLQMAAGYAMILNGGTYITPTFYTKVLDKDGNVVIECTQEKKKVMSEQNAYIEIDLLKGPVKSGTASTYNGFLGSMEVAGKTGTTETAGDRWFCGFTPYYAAACWYGNDHNNGQFHNSACGGSNPAARLWFNAMKGIDNTLTAKSFEKPDGIVQARICKQSGKVATDKCTDTYTEIFAKGTVPGECDGHITVKICKETGKLATEFCPDVEEKVFANSIDTEKNATWSPSLKESNEPKETCDIHTEAVKITVPNVVGKTEEQAKNILQNEGFKVKVLKDNKKDKKKGEVLSQSVTQAPKGAEIEITVNQYDGGTSEKPDSEKQNKTTNSNTNTNTNTNSNSIATNSTSEIKNEKTEESSSSKSTDE